MKYFLLRLHDLWLSMHWHLKVWDCSCAQRILQECFITAWSQLELETWAWSKTDRVTSRVPVGAKNLCKLTRSWSRHPVRGSRNSRGLRQRWCPWAKGRERSASCASCLASGWSWGGSHCDSWSSLPSPSPVFYWELERANSNLGPVSNLSCWGPYCRAGPQETSLIKHSAYASH